MEAVDGLEKIVKDHKIACDFARVPSYNFGTGRDKKDLKKEYRVLKNIKAKATYEENMKLPFGEFNIIKLENQARFDAVKFLQGLPKDFEIIENTRIKKFCFIRKKLWAENKIIKARRIIFATNFPIVNIRGLYAFKMYKSTSYAISVTTPARVRAIYNSIADDGLTYRDTSDGIIVGGLDHRTGRPKCNVYYDILRQNALPVVKAGELTGSRGHPSWAANDCMTFDGVPYAGRHKRLFSKNVYVITGFGKWGMTNSYACGQIVADLIDGKKNKYTKLYKPTRVLNIAVWCKFFWNYCLDVKNIFAGLLLGKRCPHMMCRMKWNKNTKTWDCPCHGSRLTKEGEIITAPTVKRKKFK